MRISGAQLVDVGIAAALFYLSFWIYEIANFAVFSVMGVQSLISFNGIVPIGTTVVTLTQEWSPFAKVAQTTLACTVVIAVLYLARKSSLKITEVSAICVVSLFLASIYWEAFSLVPYLTYPVHVSVFIGITAVIELALVTRFGPRLG